MKFACAVFELWEQTYRPTDRDVLITILRISPADETLACLLFLEIKKLSRRRETAGHHALSEMTARRKLQVAQLK